MDMKPVPAQMIFQMEYEEGFHEGYRQAMREMPEIVRCKDCKYYNSGGIDKNRNPFRGCCTRAFHSTKGDEWFCADGKRKDDGDE